MKWRDDRRADDSLGARLEQARRRRGLSHTDLARVTGLPRRHLVRLERGTAEPSDADLDVLARACDVTVAELVPPGYRFAVVVPGAAPDGALRGSDAVDALLREYVAMVLEMRNRDEIPAATLRFDDLTELSRALGGSPDAIEARLIELFGTDAEGAHRLRAAIQPSSVLDVVTRSG